jgi:hypothetical protein
MILDIKLKILCNSKICKLKDQKNPVIDVSTIDIRIN